MRVFLSGTVALEIDGATIDGARFPGRQGRILFAYLVAEQGRPVPLDELADALWGDAPPPATWDKALTVLASKLRSLLASHGVDGGAALTSAFGCYRLELPEGTWVDVVAAGAALQDAQTALDAGDPSTAKTAAAFAESTLRQTFVPGEDGAWIERKRRELADARSSALGVLVDACLGSGDASDAAKWAEEAVTLEPFHESRYRRLMEAHAAAGNRAEALRVYDRCRRLLADELGTYPSPETDAVYRDLLAAPTRAASAESPPPKKERRRRTTVLALTALAALAAIAVVALATRTSGAAVRPDSLVEIDGDAGKIDRVIPVGANPGEVAAVGRWIFVTSQDYGTLYRVAPDNGRVTISGRYSTGLSLAKQGNSLWVPSVKDGVMRLVSASSLGQERVGEIPIPRTTVPGIGVLPSVAAGGGSIWVAELADRKVSRWRTRAGASPRRVRTYPLGPVDWTIGAVYGFGAAWFALGDPADAILKINGSDGTQTRIPVGKWPTTPAFGFGSVWVPMFADDTVWRIDPSTGTPRAIVRVGRGPWDVAVGRQSIWVSDHCDGTLERIDPSTNSVVKTVHLGFHPQWLAAAGKFVWVGVAAAVQDSWPCGADHAQ